MNQAKRVKEAIMDRNPLIERKTAISYKTEEKTVMRGYDLSELAEEGYSFCDALFVMYQNRIPTEEEEKMLKYEMGVFMEHSMSPSAVGAIGVSAGRPNLPCAIAAAVTTFGGVHGPGAAHGYMLNKYLERAKKEGKTVDEMAKILVDEYMDAGKPVMGMGQPQHIDSDPRAEPIHLRQEELNLEGVYLEFQRALEKHFHARRKEAGRSYVGVNVVGSGNTALMEIGFSPNAGWCLGSVCRGFSCAAHALFNMKKGRAWGASRNEPMVQMIDLSMIKYVGPEDRVVPKQADRQEYAKKQKEEGEYKKWVI
jgi:citrate synthase